MAIGSSIQISMFVVCNMSTFCKEQYISSLVNKASSMISVAGLYCLGTVLCGDWMDDG